MKVFLAILKPFWPSFELHRLNSADLSSSPDQSHFFDLETCIWTPSNVYETDRETKWFSKTPYIYCQKLKKSKIGLSGVNSTPNQKQVVSIDFSSKIGPERGVKREIAKQNFQNL